MSNDVPHVPYRSVNPATGEVLAEYHVVRDEELEAALAAGHRAYQDWRTRNVDERAAVVRRIAREFETHANELAEIATAEMGKPLAESLEEIEFCVSIFDYYADHASRLLADQPLDTASGDRAVIQKRPVGLLLGVMPWNFPYYQVARFAAPNLVAGNTILLKHAESVPQCALVIERLIAGAGAPTAVYQNLFATHAQIEQVIADRRIQGVSLTGSERAGSTVAALAGRHLKKCVLELGGSDPYILLDLDDPASAAEQAWRTRLYNTGQACNSNKRIIVTEGEFDRFVDELTGRARAMRPCDPMTMTDNGYAPMASRAAAEHLAELIHDAVEHGAQLHAGGELAPAPAAYLSPAVLTGVTPRMRAFREELFGPVAVVYAAGSHAEALALANDSDYGLGGAVFSSDPNLAISIATELEVGMANVNTPAGEGAELPFGGVKRSGYGRELGPLGMDEFVNKRLLYIKNEAGR